MRKLFAVLLLLAGGATPALAAQTSAFAAQPTARVFVFTMAGGCGAYPGGTYFPGGCTTVRGQTVQFPPLVAPQGTGLTFVNLDTTDHTVTSGSCDGIFCSASGFFDSGHVNPHQTYDIPISSLPPGSYPFFCSIHFFTGLLTVQPIP